MNTLGFRHFPIVESNGRLAGFISERDLCAAGNMVDQPVEALMRDAVVYVDPEATIPAVVDQMVMHRIRAVPVAHADGTLHGIISYVDLLQLLQKLLPAE